MAFLENKWATVSLLFASWALITSFLTGYYWLRYTDIRSRIAGSLIYVNVGIDYGNNTRIWHNDTNAITGATLFDVTKQVANVTYQVGMFGTEIISINGVSKQGSFGWTYWIWNSTSQSWSIMWENADNYLATNRETFMWYYQNAFDPPP